MGLEKIIIRRIKNMESINIYKIQSYTPNAPKIDQPTDDQQAELDGYWKGVIKNAEFIFSMQKLIPNWLPPFNPIF
jgi:hypothetical protein